MRRLILVPAVLLAGCLSSGCTETSGDSGISAGDLRSHVGFLAADSLTGRETGESGIGKAEEYVARSFGASGLAPLPGRESYFTEFALYRRGLDAQQTSLRIEAGETVVVGRPGRDFRPFPFSDEGKRRAGLVFAGYGITAPEHGYDDYEGLDATGKFVLVLRHEPGEADPNSSFDGTSTTDHATFATKARNAESHGAVGMLLVTDPLHHPSADDMRLDGRLTLDPPERGRNERDGNVDGFLAVHIDRGVAESLVAAGGHSLTELQKAMDGGAKPSGYSLPGAAIDLAVVRQATPERVTARNVVGILEGSHPELKKEWIVIGGHHDHEGGFEGPGDTVFNGADDNASGTSGVLELAQAFASRPERTARSLVFATFSAEEKGLLGSRWLVREGVLPVTRVVYMLNLDMIGRNPGKPVRVIGDGFVKGLRELVESENSVHDLALQFSGDVYSGNSDHDPFFDQDVPFTHLFTGTHEDYHQLGDHADKLDYSRMEKLLKLAYGVVESLAEAEAAPTFVHNIGWLGARIEVLDGPDGEQAVVTAVEEGSRARLAGMRQGDVLTAFGELPLGNARFVGRRFRDIEPGETRTLAVRRGTETLGVEVVRARTGYMGVFPGPVDGEVRERLGIPDNEGILLRQVVTDGPSGKAGLRDGDIVLRIDGSAVNTANLRRRLQRIGAGETVVLTVLRDGQRQEIPVTLGDRPTGG